MQPLFSVDSIKKIEQAFVKQQGIELYELMLRAGASAFERARRLWPQASHWLIATGAGNNAGDGLVVAKHALQAGFDVTLIALKPYAELRGDPKKAWQELLSMKKEPHQTFDILSVDDAEELDLSFAEVVIDALLGTGVDGELRDHYRLMIESLNSLEAPKLALDIPTGVYAESGNCAKYNGQDIAFKADATISFIALKTGQRLNQALEYQGQLYLDTLGVKNPLAFGEQATAWSVDSHHLRDKIPTRGKVGSKFDCGHALIVGGGQNLGGAAILSATAAIKSGSGLVSCWLHGDNQTAALSHCPEVMWQAYPESPVSNDFKRFQAVGFGPGLGRSEAAEQYFLSSMKCLYQLDIPCVLDADGLYWLAQHTSVELPAKCIMTPHAGEACRLLNAQQEDVFSSGRIEPQLSVDTAYVEQNRIHVARALAKKYSAICVLKGAGTVVSDGEQCFVLAGAHPAMMTAGLGDVLTGLMTSLIAQGAKLLDAALVATQLHYEAAVSVAGARQRGVLASEVINELVVWINQLERSVK
ncbi:NAD(P)H-hydrate dehydratase [Kangiella marina]|uniref:Bifunctional NAD(P)H-hydrate repair enzyme n=1 Tax=Kangiella marina TaxID=1079178 RepID=A0ABP8ILK8_9GAMM